MDMLLLVDNYYIGTSGSCSGIYCFENLIDGKPYVGQGQLLKRRKNEHFRDLKNNNDSEYFQIAWNEVGKENFKFFILEECPTELLNEREVFWIKEFRSHISEWGYNKTWGGQCVRGYKHREETKLKISIANTGKRRTDEMNQMNRERSAGRRHTEESKQKNRESSTGRKHTEESIQKIREANTGKHPSPETIQKMIDNHADFSGENHPLFGKKASDKTRQKQRESHLGKRPSAETIQKLVESHSGINNHNILKEEKVQQIRDMLDMGIFGTKIAKELNIEKHTVYKVKNGFYKDIYGI